MKKKQKVCTMIALALMLIGAGAIEGAWWALSPICIVGAGVCVLIGGLDTKRNTIEAVLKEHGIK